MPTPTADTYTAASDATLQADTDAYGVSGA